MGLVYLNGAFVDESRARISPNDRGFLFGDGVYEVTRAVNGKLFEWPRHARRLQNSLSGLRLSFGPGMAEMEQVSGELLARNNLLGGEAYVYLQITRGAAARAHAFPPPGTPGTVFACARALASMVEERGKGVAVITAPDIRWGRCDIKSVNLLPNVLASQQAREAGAQEAVLVRAGVVTEASHSNVFAVIDDVLRTHPLTPAILPGITRAVALELAAGLGLSISEKAFSADEMAQASELFITGTNSDILPVTRVDGKAVGNGRPGPVTRRLCAAFAERLYGKSRE